MASCIDHHGDTANARKSDIRKGENANYQNNDNLEESIARRRLRVLLLAETLGSVSAACRRSNMDRTSFYMWKRRFKQHGLDGLKNLPPIHKSHPMTTPPETVQLVLEISRVHPGWGCIRISKKLLAHHIKLSAPSVQKILTRHGLARRSQRLEEHDRNVAGKAAVDHQNPD